MIIQTKYHYEKIWTDTNEKDLLRMIEEEIGDADVKATLSYIKEVIKNGKELTVGSCKFKLKGV